MKVFKKSICLFICCLMLIPLFSVASTAYEFGQHPDYIDNEIIVVSKTLPDIPENAEEFEAFGITVKAIEILITPSDPSKNYRMTFYLPGEADEDEAVDLLSAHPDVVSAEKNAVVRLPDYRENFRESGDLNADGKHDSYDYAMLKRAVLGTYVLEPLAAAAGDINGDSKLDSFDYAMLKRHCLNTYQIELPLGEVTDKMLADLEEDFGEYILPEVPEYFDLRNNTVYGPYGADEIYIAAVSYCPVPEVYTEYTVGKVTFVMSKPVTLIAWDGYKVISLEEAYEKGFISEIALKDFVARVEVK